MHSPQVNPEDKGLGTHKEQTELVGKYCKIKGQYLKKAR